MWGCSEWETLLLIHIAPTCLLHEWVYHSSKKLTRTGSRDKEKLKEIWLKKKKKNLWLSVTWCTVWPNDI